MSLFPHLEVHNFRAIHSLRVDNLGRVNVFVGANGHGKTSLLEALWLNSQSFEPWAVRRIAVEHDLGQSWDRGGQSKYLRYTLRDFCHLRSPLAACRLNLGERQIQALTLADPLALEYLHLCHSKFEARDLQRLWGEVVAIGQSPSSLEDLQQQYDDRSLEWLLSDPDIAIPIMLYSQSLPSSLGSLYLPTQPHLWMAAEQWWNGVVQRGREELIESMLRHLIPDLKRINILSRNLEKSRQGIPWVRMGQGQALPLRALGEGAVRVFQLALALEASSEGILLIDEFELGLHHEVMPPVLSQLAILAEQQQVQVFLTTHSRDVVEAVAQVAQEEPEIEFRVYRLRRLEDGSHYVYSYSAAEADAAYRLGFEVR